MLEKHLDVEASMFKAGSLFSQTDLNNLAAAYHRVGRSDKALAIYQHLFQINLKKLGRTHANTLTTLHNTASAYLYLKQPAEAVKLLEEVVAEKRKQNLVEHPATLTNMSVLGWCYHMLGRRTSEARAGRDVWLAGEGARGG